MRAALPLIGRRLLLAGAGLASMGMAPMLRVAALFAGRIDDDGFMQAGYRGLAKARDSLGVAINWSEGIKPDTASLAAALRDLAATRPSMVIAHGGQNNEAARTVAAEFPQTPFVVTQGNVTGANLGSYEVLQEQSAFLAGALAGWTTRSGTVGHMSGIRVAPGLKGRAAFAHGVAHANPAVRLLTNFSGNQDDAALSHRVAEGMIAAKADIIFTMLNAGRSGAIDACREHGVKQIGNVGDWVAQQPDVFIASAVADSGAAVYKAVEDMVNNRLKLGVIDKIGLERPDAVRLTLSTLIPPAIIERVGQLAAHVQGGAVLVPTEWSGEEFATPH